jgi:hypothetical protein
MMMMMIIIIIIIIIIISSLAKQPFLSHSLPYKILPDLIELDHPVFTSLDSTTIIFYRARSSALRPTPNLEGQISVFMSPKDRVAQLYPRARCEAACMMNSSNPLLF